MPLLVVLVRTHNPGNLGGAARAAKCFGAQLSLLQPVAGPEHPDALAFASGAEDVLARAAVLASWEEMELHADSVVVLLDMANSSTEEAGSVAKSAEQGGSGAAARSIHESVKKLREQSDVAVKTLANVS